MKKSLIIGCGCFLLALSAFAQNHTVQTTASAIQSPVLELPQAANPGLELKSTTASEIGASSNATNTDNTTGSSQNTAASLPETKISSGKAEDEKE